MVDRVPAVEPDSEPLGNCRSSIGPRIVESLRPACAQLDEYDPFTVAAHGDRVARVCLLWLMGGWRRAAPFDVIHVNNGLANITARADAYPITNAVHFAAYILVLPVGNLCVPGGEA